MRRNRWGRLIPAWAALVLAALQVLTAWTGSAAAPRPPTFRAGAASAAAVALGPLVETEDLAAHLPGAAALRPVDVRTRPEEFEKGHVPGAAYLNPSKDLVDSGHPVEGMAPTREQFEALMERLGIGRQDAVVLYDDQRSLWASRAYWVFRLYGHPRVAVLNGGITKWLAEGRSTERGPFVARSAPGPRYQASPADPALIATWKDVEAVMGSGAVCDVRSPREYAGLDVRAARGGRIPGAVNVEWVLATRPDGTFRSPDELRELYRRAGLLPEPGQEVIVYCQTGVRAAHTWFVLKEILGYPSVRVYDGSWAEWGNRADLPVER